MKDRWKLSVDCLLSGLAVVLLGALPEVAQAAVPCSAVAEHGARTSYRRCDGGAATAPGADGARAILEGHARPLGMPAGPDDLEAIQTRNGLSGSVTRFRQRHRGLPVFGAWVSVSRNANGGLRSLHSAYRSGASERVRPGLGGAAITREQAIAAAHAVFGVSRLRSPARAKRVWMPDDGALLTPAWEILSYAREPLGDFLVVIDAQTGEALFKRDLIAFDSGSGFVYEPNPVQTSGNTSLSDSGDATSPALDAERVNVGLLGLDSGTGLLRGEFVDLVTLPGGLAVPDADEPTRVYQYDRSDDRFEQVVIYHAIDTAQRYFHTLGFDDDVGVANGIRDFPTLANAHWYTQDQSFYSTGDDAVHFGDGGVDDGEDADIVIHEYGHAVQFDQNVCWGGGEMDAMGEGFGDYLAAGFYAGFGDTTHQASHAACVGEWDATSYSGANPPCLRRVDGTKIYPNDLVGEEHLDGEIWSRALWDLRAAVGSSVADQLVLEHHFSLPCNATMTDAALEILDVDLALFGGANETAIRTAFCDRGILSGNECVFSTTLELAKTAAPNPVGPGERLSYTLTVENNTTGTLTDLVLTDAVPADTSYMAWSAGDGGSASGGVVSWPPFDLLPGASTTRSFSVAVNPALSGPTTLFDDDMEGGGAAWSVSHGVGSADWALSSFATHSGSFAWRALDVSTESDQYLTLDPAVAIPAYTQLHFWHRYGTESGADGGVVEISVGGGLWSDLGPYFTQNGYDGVIGADGGSPIGGRQAFTGNNGTWVESVIDLGPFAETSVQIRFRMATDSSVGGSSWNIDDVSLESIPEIDNSADVTASEGDDDGVAITTPVVGSAASCGDGIPQPGNGERCDDANLTDGDGCNSCQIALRGEPVCGAQGELCDSLLVYGIAEGGYQVGLTVDGVTLVVITLPGQTNEEVAAAIVYAINTDPTLTAAGVLAQAVAGRVITTGSFSAAAENDPGLVLNPVVPAVEGNGLALLAAGLLAAATRRWNRLTPGRGMKNPAGSRLRGSNSADCDRY